MSNLFRQSLNNRLYQRINQDNGVVLLLHPNSIAVVTLNESHPVVQSSTDITTVNWKVTIKELRGKFKKGAPFLQKKMQLCEICLSNGDIIPIVPGIQGHVLEINERLKDSPALIRQEPENKGWLALIRLTKADYDAIFVPKSGQVGSAAVDQKMMGELKRERESIEDGMVTESKRKKRQPATSANQNDEVA